MTRRGHDMDRCEEEPRRTGMQPPAVAGSLRAASHGLPPLAPVARLAPAVHDGDDLDLGVGHDVDHDAGEAIEHEPALGPPLIERLPTVDVLLDSLERFQHLVIELVAPTGTRAIDATGRVFELDDGGRREPGVLHLPLRGRARIPAMASR